MTGPNAGKVIDPEEFERALSLYYRKRGWDDAGHIPAEAAAAFED